MSCIRVWGSDLWVPRVPSILLLCVCFLKWVPRVPSMSCIGVWGSDLWPRYQVCPVLGCGGAIYGYHGYQVYFFCVTVFVMGRTGAKYVLYWGVGERFMGTTGTKYTSSVWVSFLSNELYTKW